MQDTEYCTVILAVSLETHLLCCLPRADTAGITVPSNDAEPMLQAMLNGCSDGYSSQPSPPMSRMSRDTYVYSITGYAVGRTPRHDLTLRFDQRGGLCTPLVRGCASRT